jgi:hypothetical protein
MPTLTITINLSSAAFEDRETEVSRILDDYAKRIRLRGIPYASPLIDHNGRVVGTATITE